MALDPQTAEPSFARPCVTMCRFRITCHDVEEVLFLDGTNVEIFMNIYVGNLSFDLDDRDLQQLFEHHGSVSSAKVITDRHTGQSRGFGFVEMPDRTEAQNAIAALSDQEVDGRTIRVNEARPRN